MADQASPIAREAKSIHQDAKSIYQSVKELLKSKEPFDKELDFQRKNLRSQYLRLLLVHPYANEAKDVETRLWMETSHAFISSYKQRIAHLDNAMQRPQQGQQVSNATNSNQRGHGPVEYRKLVQRFRQFLAEEEKFWTQFVVRFTRSFNLVEAHPTLVTLGIVSEELLPAGNEGGNGTSGRNHFQFPVLPEGSESLAPKTDSQRENRMEILSKALTCLGDIARYREQYNEAGGRPRAGHQDHSGAGKRGRYKKSGGLVPELARPRNYEKARHCYEQAKLLVPHEGNPSHQLAILASYQKDMFTSLVHYYRALCVRHPYDSASDNIHTILHKAIEQKPKAKSKNEPSPEIMSSMPKMRVDAFKEKMVALHGLYSQGLARCDSLMIKQAQELFTEFYSLVSDRYLPEDFIIQVIVLPQAALWKHRMVRDSPKVHKHGDKHSGAPAPGSLPNVVIEARLFAHVLSFHRALLEVGIEQLKEPAPIGSDGDLSQRIMVEFRRALPALRIASKWLLANYKLVMQDPEALGTRSNSKGAKRAQQKSSGQISPSSIETIEFWEKYAEFLRVLSRAFPSSKLPDLTFALSEDIEMRGFLPLKDMLDAKSGENPTDHGARTTEGGAPTEEKEVHPNVVQLMRIKDILDDAKKVVDMENSPLTLYGNQFMLKGVEARAQPVPINDPIHLSDMEDDSDAILNTTLDQDEMTEATSRTDDDPVRDAFSHLNEEDEEDEIVWNPRASPVVSPKLVTTPTTPHVSPVAYNPSAAESRVRSPRTRSVHPPAVSSTASVPIVAPISPPRAPLASEQAPKAASSIPLTTAQDLLNGFMATRSSPIARMQSGPPSDPLASTAPLLFGDRGGNNIWSTSQDEQASMRINGSQNYQQNTRTHPDEFLRGKVQPHSQWPPSPNLYRHTAQPMSTQNMSGMSPAGGLSSPSQYATQHRRIPSSSAVAAQLFPDPVRNPGISEYGYGSYHSALSPSSMQHQSSGPHVAPTTYVGMNQNPIGTGSGSFYDSSVPTHHGYSNPSNPSLSTMNQHSLHIPLHDPRMNGQNHTVHEMPSLWGSAG